MIARDESAFLEQAILSVAPVVSEIILVDTGSTDNTIEIAEKHNAKIIQEPWRDDFSYSRNISLNAATCDWILVLDADEAIDESSHQRIHELTSKQNYCYLLTQRHYTNDQRLSNFQPCQGAFPQWERNYVGFFESKLCRLFPNDPRIRYRGNVHELVEHTINECSELTLADSGIRLHHYGHTPEVSAKKMKTKLYTPLGQKKVEQEPTTWKGYYELGVEHNCNGRRAESAEALKKAAELNPEYLSTWVNLGYVLTELEKYQEAYGALQQALKLDSNSAEAHCNLGVLLMRMKRFDVAAAHFQRAIGLKKDYLNAYSNLGTCLMKLRRVQDASRVFNAGYQLAPRNSQLLVRFGHSLLEFGILEDAKRILEQAVSISPGDGPGWFTLAQTLKGLNDKEGYEQAITKCKELGIVK